MSADQAPLRSAEPAQVGSSSGFWLQKWYLDAADEAGNVYIGYWASVRWKSLSLHYYEHIWRTPQGPGGSRAAFVARPAPTLQSATRLTWNTPEAQAEWTSTGEAQLSERLLETRQGSIDWRCYQPKARAEIRLPELSLTGWGYTECLEISIRPWQLPLKRLYWGRGHSRDHYLVWIKWQGRTCKSVLWHDGLRTTEFDVSETGIRAPSIELQVRERRTLRKGSIRSTVFHSMGRLASLVPGRALLVDERKMFGTGQIVADGRSQPAAAIYEEVLW